MPEKPSYLDMLNAIYMGEQRGYEYLSAWADVTPDPDVRAVLRTIALREGEHAFAFAKRINELGFEAHDDGPSEEFHRKLAIVTSDTSDLEKMDTLGYNFSEPPKPSDEGDRLVGLIRDTTIDIRDRRAPRSLHRRGARHRASVPVVLRRALRARRWYRICRTVVGSARRYRRTRGEGRRGVPGGRGAASDRVRADDGRRQPLDARYRAAAAASDHARWPRSPRRHCPASASATTS